MYIATIVFTAGRWYLLARSDQSDEIRRLVGVVPAHLEVILTGRQGEARESGLTYRLGASVCQI